MHDDMYELIKAHVRNNRSPVSEPNNALVKDVTKILNGNLIESSSGTDVLKWKIPKHWNVREAYIAKTTGERIIDYKNSCLHLWTHSVSFDGILKKEDLREHIIFDIEHPDWIPYHCRNGYRYDVETWGFSMSYNQWIEFTEDEYVVFIDADLNNNGAMLTSNCLVRGKFSETIFLAAHSCHPAIATDGLTNVAVLVELFKILQKRSNKYSYRCIIGSEYYAAASFLTNTSQTELANMKNGIYLDMLGNRQNFAYQSSFQGDSPLDKITHNVFKHHLNKFSIYKYRELWGNDEMFYNGPGFNIPTLGIAGCKHAEYHYDADNFELIDFNQLEHAVNILLKIIEVLETDYKPLLKYTGPLYLSDYDLYIDPYIDKDGYRNIEAIQILADGNKSCFQIADILGIDFFWVKDIFDKLFSHSLISKKETKVFD